MAIPEETRKYNMPDGDLQQQGKKSVRLARRDIADLAPRGVDAAYITRLDNAVTAFASFPTDPELQGPVTNAADAKNAARSTLEIGIRSIRNMAERRYGVAGGSYKTFQFEGLSRLSDNDLVRCGNRVVRVATTLQTDMTAQGLTPAVIATLQTQANTFNNSVEAVGAAEETRDLRTQERVRRGNALYDRIMDLAGIGQDVYAATDEAKYNDYIVNNEPPAGPDAPPAP